MDLGNFITHLGVQIKHIANPYSPQITQIYLKFHTRCRNGLIHLEVSLFNTCASVSVISFGKIETVFFTHRDCYINVFSLIYSDSNT